MEPTESTNKEDDHIFRHFCNCIYLGQWQLARACIPQVQKVKRHNVRDILKDVASHPFNRSVLSTSVPSPCQLSWLCLLEHEKLQQLSESQTEGTSLDQKLAEFHLLLIEVCPYITDTVLKELYLYFRWIHSVVSVNHQLTLSPSLLKFLKSLLSRQPDLGHALISSIYNSQNPVLAKNNKALLLVYMRSINALLDSFTGQDLDNDNKVEIADKIYDILSVFEPDCDVSQLPLRQMYCKILEHAKHDSSHISKLQVMSVLAGHTESQLLHEFCRLDYELETNNAVAMYQSSAELTEEERWILYLSSVPDINTRWKMFFLMSIKNKRHLLEVIMETGLALIKCNRLDGLQQLLEPLELHPLKPLLLLLGWTHCYSNTEARQLLNTLWTDKSVCDHPAITMGCNKLAYQIDLIQWCLDKAKPLLSEETVGGPHIQRAADLFKGLESHSVLYVLHNSTRLSALDQQEVLDLLQKVPLQGQKEQDGEKKKKAKTVRFQEASNTSVKQVTSLDQQKDMAIYTGYCVLKNIMDAILFCSESSDDRLTNPVRSKCRRKISSRVSEAASESDLSRQTSSISNISDNVFPEDGTTPINGTLTNSPRFNVQSLYKENVTTRLSQAKTFLSQMQPLTFRVEILEDIFSFLFLTHEDIQEDLVMSEFNSNVEDDSRSYRSASTGGETPLLLSPQKESSAFFKAADVSINVTEHGADYDIPFEEAKRSNDESSVPRDVNMDKVGEILENVRLKISDSKERLLKEAQKDSRLSSMSENISSISNSSSANLNRFGFILNEYLVRDILAFIKDCIIDVSAAKFQIHGKKSDVRERYRSSREMSEQASTDIDPTIEEALCRLVKSSVTMETLQKRITQLERYTSEAHWRYQLVVNVTVPGTVGEVLPEVVIAGDTSDEEVEIAHHHKSHRRRKSGRNREPSTPDSLLSEGSIHGDITHRQISQVSTASSLSVSRQQSVARQPGGQVRSQSVVSLMLASPVSLLTMSIRRGQLTQTKQIIKLFKLEDRPEAIEVYFSQAFYKASRGVQGIMGKKSVPSADNTPGKPSMKALANVAAAGVATASIANVADEILNFPTLPLMPKIESNENIPQHIMKNFQAEYLPVIILLDLLCSAARSWEVCNHLIDVLKLRLPLTPEDSSKKVPDPVMAGAVAKQRVNRIRTFSDVVSQLEALVHLGAEDQFPRQEQTSITRTFQKSVQSYLTQAVSSLNADRCKEYVTLCQNLTKKVHRVEEAFHQHRVKHSENHGRQRLSSTDSRSDKHDKDKYDSHHCVKQLIYSLDKDVPTGGLVAMVTQYGGKHPGQNKNYLLSLYEHCKELSYLVAESDSISKETMVLSRNYFEMLEEGPLRILGRMMFKKKMPPAKLERVATKLSLNLTHIIVYSCCIKIPSKQLPLIHNRPVSQIDSGKVIYNCSEMTYTTSLSNPEDFVRTLLTRLVTLMKDIASRCNAESLFDYTCVEMMTKTTEYDDIITQTSALQSADLLHLDKVHRRCFYGNLQTLMTIHCFVSHTQAVKSQISNPPSMTPTQDRQPLFSDMTATEQITHLNMFSYRLGQLGVVSLFDLKYQLNRCGLLAPSEWGRTLDHRLHPLDPCDPWYKLAPTPDPQLLFAMTTCCVSSPPVQVLVPDTLKEQLNSSIQNYLQGTVHVDKHTKLIKVPELLLWHRRDFLSDCHSQEYVADKVGLVAFIASQLTGDKLADINKLLKDGTADSGKRDSSHESSFEIEVVPHCKDFLCVFDFDSITRAVAHHSSSNKSPSARSRSGDSILSDSDTTYNLTPNTLEYIKSDCPLVATLVSLVCSDEFNEAGTDDAFDDSFFNVSISSQDSGHSNLGSKRSRASSSMSLVDIRSYRYEKLTNEYPTLKRHLLNYIVPLAATEDHDILKGDDPILKLLTSDIIDRFKSNMLSLHESVHFRTLLTGLLNELFHLRKWSELLQVIDSVPVTVVRRSTSLCNVHDFVVCCLIHTYCAAVGAKATLQKVKSEEVITLLRRMISAETQVHELLTVHEKLQIEHNMEMFDMCLYKEGLGQYLREAIQQKFAQIKVLHRITECAKNLQFKLSLKTSELITEEDKLAAKKRHLILDKFTDWHTVTEWTKSSPREVLALLIKTGDFNTAKSWGHIEKLHNNIQMEIEENHICSLLNTQPPNTSKAFMLLETLHQSQCDACVTMCWKFVDTFNHQRDVMFITNYMLNQLTDQLSQEEIDRLRLIHIGSRMILCLPEPMHIEYSHLVTSPRYILEQLLMNMKPELAGRAFQTVQTEFDLVHTTDSRFTVEQFNTLVALYAKKALEFTVIQYLDLGDKERSFSVKSTSSTDRLDPDVGRGSPHLRHSPQPRGSGIMDTLHSKRRSVDIHGLSKYAVSAPTGSPGHRVASLVAKEKFTMPTEPPPRDQWIADSTTSVCMVCKVERFSMFNRRHHCRRCGRVVCAACSDNVTPIKGINARTCNDCYGEIVKSSSSELPNTTVDDMYHQRTARLSGSSLASTPHIGPHDTGTMVTTIQEEGTLSLSNVVNHTHTVWKLKTEETYNSNLREDFYFEQAPSTSLCISLLNLHGNPRECGQLILNLCDDLSKFLKPLAPGIPNPEVDYTLIMSMMKYLLFHAKIKFIKCSDNAGMGQCDVYQGLVDLLGLLVVDNYRDIPSIQELTKVDIVRRLRDKLIENERLSLAMEVSTKCGLDPAGVWVAMGVACLQGGDFTGAREKFSKCLKPPKDKNVCAPLPNVVQDIIDSLETMPGTGAMEIQVLLANPGSIKNLIFTPSSTFFEEASMDSKQFQECVYYLRTYGSYLSLVDFHRRHGYYMKAVQYVLDHKCSMEVFIEGLLKPSIETGELGRLTDQMLMIDKSLDRWNLYLTGACRYLVKAKLHHVLYDFQLFMKDYIRAGMTCYTYFYSGGARSYTDLSRRIQYLFTAQQHMQAYLDPGQWGNVQHPLTVTPKRQGSWEDKGPRGEQGAVRLVKGHEDVKRYIKTIALQIEVTKFLQTCITNGTGDLATMAGSQHRVPTLFDTKETRNDLTIMILLSGDDVETSFALATRIIKEYKLNAVPIYTHAAREMAKGHHYDNMRQLLGCIEKVAMGNDDDLDEILGACLLVVSDDPKQAKEAENIIKLLHKDANKINAFILCGKLRSAYLMAVKMNRVDDVRRILRAAKSMGQSAVINICNKWLEQNHPS